MIEVVSGSFFSYPVSSIRVLEFLDGKHILQLKEGGPSYVSLDGVCDSRKGGNKKLVFAKCQNFHKSKELTESFILIDDFPDKKNQGSNLFCKVVDPRAAFIDLLKWLIASVDVDAHCRGFKNKATISRDAQVASSAVIEPGVEVGPGSIISAGAVIKSGTCIGKNTVIRENVVVGSDGANVYRSVDGRLLKFPHVGGVFIGNNSEISANTVIAGGVLEATSIGNNVIIGNLCNIGHSVIIEDDVWMSVGTLLGGHTSIHVGTTIGMGVTVRDNLVVSAGASLGMGSVVVKNVESNHSVFGNPAKRMVGLKTGPKR